MKHRVTKLFWLLLASASLTFGLSMNANASTLPSEAVPVHCGSCGTGGEHEHDEKKKDGKKDESMEETDVSAYPLLNEIDERCRALEAFDIAMPEKQPDVLGEGAI